MLSSLPTKSSTSCEDPSTFTVNASSKHKQQKLSVLWLCMSGQVNCFTSAEAQLINTQAMWYQTPMGYECVAPQLPPKSQQINANTVWGIMIPNTDKSHCPKSWAFLNSILFAVRVCAFKDFLFHLWSQSIHQSLEEGRGVKLHHAGQWSWMVDARRQCTAESNAISTIHIKTAFQQSTMLEICICVSYWSVYLTEGFEKNIHS